MGSSKRMRKDNSEESSIATSSQAPVVVFAHGAGAPSSSDWMIRWKELLEKALHAVEVVTFDYPYFSGKRKRVPPKAEKLMDFHKDIVKKTVAKYPGHPLILAGKSMGSSYEIRDNFRQQMYIGRCPIKHCAMVSCMVASELDIAASAVICLGYPLKGRNGALRDDILLQLTIPVMFVQGSKDGFCPVERLDAVRKRMKSQNELHVIDGGDHSLKIAKKLLQLKGTQDEAEELAVQAVASFASKAIGWQE